MAQEQTSVSSAEFVRRFGSWQDRIAADPVFVTHHGRRRLVMLSAASYDRLVGDAPAPAPDADDADQVAVRHDILLDQLDAGFVALDADLRIVQANPAACSYFAIARGTAQGRSIDAHCADLAQTVARGHLARALQAGEVAHFEIPSVSYPGAWLRLRIFPYGTGVGCLFRTVTAERDLQRIADAEAGVRAALAADGTIGLAQLTPRATFCDVDATLAQMAGFVRASLLQVRLVDILPLARRVAAAAAIEAVLTGGAPVAFDSALLVNNGAERAVRIAAAPLRGALGVDGAMVAVVGR